MHIRKIHMIEIIFSRSNKIQNKMQLINTLWLYCGALTGNSLQKLQPFFTLKFKRKLIKNFWTSQFDGRISGHHFSEENAADYKMGSNTF